MDYQIGLYLSILVLGIFLLGREVFPLEIGALFIVVLLTLSGIVDHREAFAHFGNDSIILIASLFILTAGLRRTGIIKKIEDFFLLLGGKSKTLSFIVLMLLVAFVSAFVSNTATLAVVIPIAVSMAHSHGESPRSWLLPLAFVSVLGGMNSLIGTSTNIIISGLLPDYGLAEFHLFSTATVAFPLLIIGFVYLLVSRNLFFRGDGKVSETRIDVKYDLRNYSTEVLVSEDSPLCDKSLENSALFKEVDIMVLGVARKNQPLLYPRAGFVVRANDRLLVEGNITKLTEITDRYGLQFAEQTPLEEVSEESKSGDNGQTALEVELHEVLVNANSMINNRTAAEVFLRNRYRISLIAINRQGVTIHEKLSKVRIVSGDILVVQFLGYIDNTILEFLGLVPLQKLETERYLYKKGFIAATLFFASLFIGSTSGIPLSVCSLFGAILLVMFRILRINEVYESVNWKVLIFIGAILTLGRGMSTSGTADFLAANLAIVFDSMQASYALAFFLITTVVVTSLLSNQATAVVMLPIAVSTSQSLNLDPMPFVMAVTIGASCCFITPFEPVFMMVYGPGEYRFKDFLRFGLILNIMCIALAIVLIPYFFPL